ncbi:MAG: hypothetical protein Q7T74_04460 [Candidatus Saccharibacteria bacterium]|nr:hypothetical protein [Candidatus Saccharibacteria bacterium]
MSKQVKGPALEELEPRSDVGIIVGEEPAYVSEFDEFIENTLYYEPQEASAFSKHLPEVHFSFGETPKNDRYFVGVRFDKNTELSKQIAGNDSPYTGQRFLFTIDDDGSLLRIIELSHKDDDYKRAIHFFKTNLGARKGQEFVEFLQKASKVPTNDILKFCELSDDEIEKVIVVQNLVRVAQGIED